MARCPTTAWRGGESTPPNVDMKARSPDAVYHHNTRSSAYSPTYLRCRLRLIPGREYCDPMVRVLDGRLLYDHHAAHLHAGGPTRIGPLVWDGYIVFVEEPSLLRKVRPGAGMAWCVLWRAVRTIVRVLL